VSVVSNSAVLGHELPIILDRGGNDQVVGWVACKGSWQKDSGIRDGWRDPDGSHSRPETFEPAAGR